MDNFDQEERPSTEDGEETWLLTYVDMVSLLLGLFIILYAFSSVDAKKLEIALQQIQASLGGASQEAIQNAQEATKAVQAASKTAAVLKRIQDSLGGPKKAATSTSDTGSASSSSSATKGTEDLVRLQQMIRGVIQDMGLEASIELATDPRGVVLTAKGGVLFESGNADLSEEGVRFLRRIAPLFTQFPFNVMVEGHTDDVPITTERFPSNWELSTARASRVVRYMIEDGDIAPQRMSAAGYAHYRPRVVATPENRSQNRRVEIVILRGP